MRFEPASGTGAHASADRNSRRDAAARFAAAGAADPAAAPGPVAGSRADFAAKATDRVYFDYDQHNLDDADRNALTSQISWLKQYPRTRVEIQGHADERGTQDYNIALGARRAEAVSSYLKAQGIAADRIQTISFGKDKPLDTGHDEAAWARNRNAYTNIIVEAIS